MRLGYKPTAKPQYADIGWHAKLEIDIRATLTGMHYLCASALGTIALSTRSAKDTHTIQCHDEQYKAPSTMVGDGCQFSAHH
jgi:hypothetical protein